MDIKRNLNGWKKQPIDKRDYIYKSPMATIAQLPSKVDLRIYDSPVDRQGGLGDCVSESLTTILEILEIKHDCPSFFLFKCIKLYSMKIIRGILNFFRISNWYAKDLSRLFVYYNGRDLEGSVDIDSGLIIRDGIKALADKGVCLEKSWPYIEEKFNVKPNDMCYEEGLKHKILEYKAINTLTDMKSCLSEGFPFVCGIILYYSFQFGESINKKGIVEMPKQGEAIIGSHCITIVGYDASKQLFIAKNSWGRTWGKNGYFFIPFSYLANPDLASDMWMVSKLDNV